MQLFLDKETAFMGTSDIMCVPGYEGASKSAMIKSVFHMSSLYNTVGSIKTMEAGRLSKSNAIKSNLHFYREVMPLLPLSRASFHQSAVVSSHLPLVSLISCECLSPFLSSVVRQVICSLCCYSTINLLPLSGMGGGDVG